MLSRTQPRPVGNPLLPLDEIQNPMIDAISRRSPQGRFPAFLPRVRLSSVATGRSTPPGTARPDGTGYATSCSGPCGAGNTLDDYIAAFDVHLGTPQQVVTSLQRDTALARVTDVSFQVHSIDPPHEQILTSIELLATDVAPALGWRACYRLLHKETV
ncbi:hypothetical protein ERHA55_51700 (plasmid) [Erwinia rhapontici]|nr:hypothetical protein ERHA55_51700 [Erwinia rhapontici]